MNMIISFCKAKAPPKLIRRLFSSYRVLGIESSCDDTGAGVVNSNKEILGEGHFSQSKLHVETGGILGHAAQYLHEHSLKEVVDTCMEQSKLKFEDLNAIAVTVKPGLILSLTAGVDFAKNLCKVYNKPLIPIHHMEAHALTARLIHDVKFPFLCLLISGGHCILSVVESPDKFYTLAKHLDTTPGQAMDKVARRTKLNTLRKFKGMVGGAAIEKAAVSGDPNAFDYIYSTTMKSCNFSFSGIITKFVNVITEEEKIKGVAPDEVLPNVNDVCASFQWNLTKILCKRVENVILYLRYKNWPTENSGNLVVSGGVASNQFIREALKYVCDYYEYQLIVPPPKLCTDNGVMIAWNGIEKLQTNTPLIHPSELDSVTPLSKCPLGEDVSDDVNDFMKSYKKPMPLNKFLNFYKKPIEEVCQQ